MSELGATTLTLSDWAKRLDPNMAPARIIEMLAQTNEILADMGFQEGNLVTGHRLTMRTGLPTVYWKTLNRGTPTSKSLTAQVDEQAAKLDAWSEMDVDLAKLGGNTAAVRLSEARAFIEAMNQEFASTLFYGNAGISPEEFTGLAPRYSDTTAANGQNIVLGGGSGADNTSMWLVVWGDTSVFGIFPKGSAAGLKHVDHGEQTVQDAGGESGTRMRVFQDQFKWDVGLALKDWRFAVRIPNIDVSNLATTDPGLVNLLIRAFHRIPSFNVGKAAIYVNRTVRQYFDIYRLANVSTGGGLSYDNVDGKPVVSFRGIPIRVCDSILENEALVS